MDKKHPRTYFHLSFSFSFFLTGRTNIVMPIKRCYGNYVRGRHCRKCLFFSHTIFSIFNLLVDLLFQGDIYDLRSISLLCGLKSYQLAIIWHSDFVLIIFFLLLLLLLLF